MSKRILIIDDEPLVMRALKRLLEDLGYETVGAESGTEGIRLLESEPFDLCITDLAMPGPDGFAVLEAARKHVPRVATMVITGQGTVKDAVSALRAGALDFISKPFHDSAVEASVRRYLDGAGQSGTWQPTHGAALIGEHPAIRLVLERIDQVADSDACVFIRGEEGTGKEVVARLIHASSERRSGPFVGVNMAAIPQQLVEAELFGYMAGAFAGADRPKTGKVLLAQGGTLYLDEITEMSPALQARILEVINDRKARPMGSDQAVPLDVRVIASTHRNVDQMVRDGNFNEDLYYRFNVIPIELPALRDRTDDIRPLAEHFRAEMNARHARSVKSFHPDVIDRLRTYDWPGNVRQLLQVIERVVINASNREVAVDDLPPNLRTSVLDLTNTPLDLPACGVDLRLLLSQLEDRLIGQALKRTGGNKNRAAELLGLNRTTLVEKLRRRSVA